MKVFIATDYSISICNGKYYIENAMSSILNRYYENFGKIMYCSRIENVESSEKLIDISDIIDSVIVINNLFEALSGKCCKKMMIYMKDCSLIVGRVPSIIAYRAFDCAKKLKKPFYSEAMGCAWDAYWNHGLVGKVIAPYMYYKMKSVVSDADYALYVTDKFLQKRYPCKKESVAVSNVRLDSICEKDLLYRLERIDSFRKENVSLMTSAAVDVRYKGQEYVIEALGILKQKGIVATYYLAGGGDQTYLKSVAKKYGVQNQVLFLGRLSLNEVFEMLANIDIYIQPSLQEGLPRSMIEAMSKAVPCIGARTAGIPELINKECVVKRKSAKEIANAIVAISNKDKMKELANNNFVTAGKYHNDILAKKRNDYYSYVKRNIC